MPITTVGHVSVTPVRIETTATLPQLKAATTDLPYEGKAPSEGWGNVYEGDEIVGKSLKGRPTTRSGGEIVEEDDLHPEQFRARLFWDELDRKALVMFGESGDPDFLHTLQATDITISRTAEAGVLVGLLGLRTQGSIRNHVVPALKRLLLAVDENAVVYQDSSPLDFGDDDFFHWLLYSLHHSPQVASDIKLTSVRSINSQDGYYRGASIDHGADLDRPELLALIGAANNHFGPAKLTLKDATLDLDLDFELRVDGGFSAFVGGSSYGVELDRATKGLRLVQDIAYKVIPDLKAAYDADSSWRATGRAGFLTDAREQLVASLLPQGCPHCSHSIP